MVDKGRVLVVDDEASVLDILGRHLAALGYDVVTADSVKAASGMTAGERFDVALVDLRLSDGDGLELIRCFQSEDPGLRSVIMTENATVESTIEALRLNVFDFIQKPFDLVRIGEVVDAAVAGADMRRENAAMIEELEAANRRLEECRSEFEARIISANEELGRVNASLKRHVTRLKMLFQMGRDISSNENWSDALDRFLMAFCRYLEADGAAMLLFSGGGSTLQIRTSFNIEEKYLQTAIRLILEAQKRDNLPVEIFNLDSCGGDAIETCLATTRAWSNSAIPLLYKGRWLGFLLARKRYGSRREYLGDYHFITTIQTILTEEVANAANISRLRNLKDFNETILESMHSGVVRTDRFGMIVFANRRAREVLGEVASGDVHLDRLFHDPAGSSGMFEYLAGGGDLSFEAVCAVPGGKTVPVSINSAVVESDEFHGKVVVLVFEDLAARKQLEDQLRKADRLRSLGELSAGVAHEIRNPLTGIATTAQVLKEGLAGDAKKIKFVDVILGEIRRLDDIIGNLLHFARPAAPRPVEVSMSGLMEDAMVFVSDSADEAGVSVRCAIEGADDRCVLDRDQIKQVMLNLVMNGVQACRRGGEVTVVLRDAPSPGFVRLDVTDNGSGIPEDVADRLYNPFFTTRPGGTGLGLSITRAIIESHGGRIYHVSEPGVGTTFHVDLPRRKTPTTAAEEMQEIS